MDVWMGRNLFNEALFDEVIIWLFPILYNDNYCCNKWCMWVIFYMQLKDEFPEVGLLSCKECVK